jgi:hypothetical protein
MKSLYSKLGLQYQQAYDGPYSDLSVATDDYRLVVAKNKKGLTGFGRPIVCFGDTKKALRPFKRLYKACKNVWYMSYDGLDHIGRFLLEQGIKPTVFYTQVVDLTKSVPDLHADMRKSYQHLANKYEAKISQYYLDIDKLKRLHFDVCGFQTRSDKTWQVHKTMVSEGEAFIVHSPSWNAASLFIYGKGVCYYGVSKALEGAYSHPLLWKAICHAKTLGCTELELGEQIFIGDKKEVGISLFKRGFGGTTRARLEFKTR